KNTKEIRGKGLMIGIELNESVGEIRNKMLFEDHIFTGAAGSNTIRLLPSLAITKAEADRFLDALKKYVK
ncbi:MAG: aminotransferase class III-fold pyridoxal phosphate-dependent enzyme, partial [Leadbetterella sp.]|nr:aminotransferase class III-fold pyridoxal phosphate-dependent enzyme [Leadbetterella sp.]